MSRSLILSEQFADPAVAFALRQHREDRAVLLASLTTSLQSDPRILAVWFHGSFGRGEADDLSDLDLWIAVSDEAVSDEFAVGMNASLCGHAATTTHFIGGKETFQIAPPSGGFFTSRHEGRQGFLGIDWAWQPQSALTLPTAVTILFERTQQDALLPVPVLPFVTLGRDINEAPIEGGLFFAWLMIGVAAMHLARDPQSDMALMLYPRFVFEDAIIALGQSDILLPIDWSVPDDPLDKLERLRGLAGIVAQTVDIAHAQEYLFPPRYLPCLFRYLKLVEGILKATMKH